MRNHGLNSGRLKFYFIAQREFLSQRDGAPGDRGARDSARQSTGNDFH